MQPLPRSASVCFAGLSDRGRVRAHNEDAIALDPALGLAVLADGMGGHQAGEVASAIAVQTVRARLGASLTRGVTPEEIEPSVCAAVTAANQAILTVAAHMPACHGMGTTLVLALFTRNTVTVAHVGDSRAYRLRAGELQALTRDHSLVQQQIDAGLLRPEQARQRRERHVLTRALGIEGGRVPALSSHPLQPGDRYLLCSDGLHDMLSDERIGTELHRTPGPQAAARALLDAANEAGGHDNISVIVADWPSDRNFRSAPCPG